MSLRIRSSSHVQIETTEVHRTWRRWWVVRTRVTIVKDPRDLTHIKSIKVRYLYDLGLRRGGGGGGEELVVEAWDTQESGWQT